MQSGNDTAKMTETTPEENLENLSGVIQQPQDGTLYYTLDECYIYSVPGKPNGEPVNDSDVLYDTEIDEILELDLEKRDGDYVEVKLPIKGYIFLPEAEENMKYEDDHTKMEVEEKKPEYKPKDPDDAPITIEDEEELQGKVDFGEERRDYSKQRMSQLVKEPIFKKEDEKMWIKNEKLDGWLKNLIFFFRSKPFWPGLIIYTIQFVIESFILFDVYTDVVVIGELKGGSNDDVRLEFWFMMTCVFIAAPYLIAWSAVSTMAGKKLREHSDSILWKILIVFFDVAPIGAAMLFINDIFHWCEAAAKPVWQILTFGRPWIRNISFEELGYYKLRRVSEIFAESICQTGVQAYIFIRGIYPGNALSIIASLISSGFITCLWSTIIFFEGRANGMSFAEYTTVIFQGSFNFVPKLPAIERGSPNGEKVNWTYYKISSDGVGHVGKALLSRNCRLKFLKISTYTFATLHRFGAKYFGSMITNSPQDVELCVSRLEEEVRELFEKFDTDNDWSFDFWEFTRVSLMLKKSVKERLIRKDVNEIFLDLADSIRRKVWLLDLIIKIRGSVERIPLLDFDLPLDYALEKFDYKLMSFLMAFKYDEISDYTRNEFQKCCTKAITYDPEDDPEAESLTEEQKIQKMETSVGAAMCLCEDKGVPIVVKVIRGENLLPMDDDGKSDPYIRVDCLGIEEVTSIRKQTLNPIWEEDLLFILPFDAASALLKASADKSKSALPKVAENGTVGPSGSSSGLDSGNAASSFGVRAASGDNVLKTHIPDMSSLPQYITKYKFDESSFRVTNSNVGKTPSTDDLGALASFGDRQLSDKQQSDSMQKIETVDSRPNSPSLYDKYRKMSNNQVGNGPVAGGGDHRLVLKFKLHDFDANDEDDFMGSYKIKVDLQENTTNYHKKLHRVFVRHFQREDKTSGTIEFRIYLNVLQYYQDYGLTFIDDINTKSTFKANDDELFEKMAQGNDKEQQLTFQV